MPSKTSGYVHVVIEFVIEGCYHAGLWIEDTQLNFHSAFLHQGVSNWMLAVIQVFFFPFFFFFFFSGGGEGRNTPSHFMKPTGSAHMIVH